jgi:hypothetical protein
MFLQLPPPQPLLQPQSLFHLETMEAIITTLIIILTVTITNITIRPRLVIGFPLRTL